MAVVSFGLATIAGSGGSGGSSTDYETFSPTIDFDTIRVVFDANDPDPETVSCTSYTSMNQEFQKAYPEETRDLTIVDGTVDAVEVKYTNAFYVSRGSDEPIACQSYIEGDLGGGILDATSIDPPSSGWAQAQNPNVFANYIITDPTAEFRICVQCLNNNLYSSYTLDYLARISMTLTARETNQEENTE